MIYLLVLGTLPFFIHVLHYAIQEGRIFGFWQKVLAFLYRRKITRPLEKMLGGCYLCFANQCTFWTMVILWVTVGKPLESLLLSVLLSAYLISTVVVASLFVHNKITKEQ